MDGDVSVKSAPAAGAEKRSNFMDYLWLWWDGIGGLGGWGHNDTKLPRLPGVPAGSTSLKVFPKRRVKRGPRCYDNWLPWLNLRYLIFNTSIFYIIYQVFRPAVVCVDGVDPLGVKCEPESKLKKNFLVLN